jgi:hypothetical protein
VNIAYVAITSVGGSATPPWVGYAYATFFVLLASGGYGGGNNVQGTFTLGQNLSQIRAAVTEAVQEQVAATLGIENIYVQFIG